MLVIPKPPEILTETFPETVMTTLLQIHEPGETPALHEGEHDLAVGIDLGTTNSAVAISHDGRPEILPGEDGSFLVPSVAAYSEDTKALPMVGELARQALLEEPESVVSSIKRLMGRKAEDIKSLAGTLPFEPAVGQDGDEEGGMVRLKVRGRTLTPVEISADILRALKMRAETTLDHAVDRAVVTVPAYFDDAARTATRDAARLAGLEVLRLVNEPTAAALAYGLDKNAEGVFAVYDLGGGTFDVSLLRMEKGIFQVLATGGDAALGGDDFDHAIAEYFLAQRTEGNSSHALTRTEVKTALMSARLAKECLSSAPDGEWVIDTDGATTHHRLDRETYESLIVSFVERTTDICRHVIEDAGLAPEDVSGVVLVGGSTRVPLVRARVAELFGREPLADIDPDTVVALGAAIQAEALTIGSDSLLLDVTPLSLGIETMGKITEKVISRNTPIPVSKTQEFTTYQDGQTAMIIHVVQGEREMVSQNRSLARFELHGIPPMTAGAARVLVTFIIDADGLLTVSAREQTTGLEQHVEVKPSYGIREEDMARMLRESMEHAKSDMSERLLAEAQVDGERMLVALGAAFSADGDLCAEAERDHINRVVTHLRDAIAGADRDTIYARIAELDKVSCAFAERRMDRGIRKALEGKQVSELTEDDLSSGAGAGEDKKGDDIATAR